MLLQIARSRGLLTAQRDQYIAGLLHQHPADTLLADATLQRAQQGKELGVLLELLQDEHVRVAASASALAIAEAVCIRAEALSRLAGEGLESCRLSKSPRSRRNHNRCAVAVCCMAQYVRMQGGIARC